ncbi:broad-complex core protein isoforms 1/2/3/4/5 [Penaeus vannamei]|uniref:broad-complex core protein isoforms 1/2/3/4/5 n=1 Tax=Penaeus vannamei TaxID=6689 RepID=UPI00387F949C
MGADQQFCLRWNNFHTNITSAFESLRDDEDFVDITLACEGRQIKAHKMVLSACSPYFRSLLKGNPCQHPIVFLKDVTFANLTSILDFMYHGEVNVSHNELATFLKTAEALKVRGLAEDEKKRDSENYNESSSPPPPRDPPDPGSPRPEEGSSAPDTQLSDSPPPKRQRRRSGASVHSAEDTNETVLSEARDSSVKNEPQDFNEEEDMLSQSVEHENIKTDVGEDSEERNFGPSESVTISRSQAAMQQLQESFGSFLPGMGQSPGFLPHGATDMPRPPPYPLEGVQGLPPGISALPGPSMSQGAASQDASQVDPRRQQQCPICFKWLSKRTHLPTHIRDQHSSTTTYQHKCDVCNKHYRTRNALANHKSLQHRGKQAQQPMQQYQPQQHVQTTALRQLPLAQQQHQDVVQGHQNKVTNPLSSAPLTSPTSLAAHPLASPTSLPQHSLPSPTPQSSSSSSSSASLSSPTIHTATPGSRRLSEHGVAPAEHQGQRQHQQQGGPPQQFQGQQKHPPVQQNTFTQGSARHSAPTTR